MSLSKVCLAIVDDDPDVLMLLKHNLTKKDYEVWAFESVAEFFDHEFVNQPQVIISDISMPEVDGFQFITQLKEQPKYSLIPVIVLTAHSTVEDVKKATQLGAVDYVVKPIDMQTFFKKVEGVLGLDGVRYVEFATGSKNANAAVRFPFHMIRMSETRVLAESEVPLPIGHTLQIEGHFLQSMGIDEVSVKILECTETEGKFYINMELVQLDRKQHQVLKDQVYRLHKR